MRKLSGLMCLLLSISFPGWTLTFTVVGPCDETPMLKKELSPGDFILGELTTRILAGNSIPFQGDNSGIKSIAGSPVGDEALEVLSDSQMRAYGWCVSIDGKQPDKMPDEVRINKSHTNIVWFYAFTFYDQGVWKDICTPSYKIRSEFICGKPGSDQ